MHKKVIHKPHTTFAQLHEPVMVQEVINLLSVRAKMTILDCTLGLGGHAEEFLKRIGPEGFLIGIDKDAGNLAKARERLQIYTSQTYLTHCGFENLEKVLRESGKELVDGILFDLGVSSVHFDDEKKGFSYQKNGPLDMRFDQSSGMTAADILNQASETDLKLIFRKYGEEQRAGKLAKMIVARRDLKKIEMTSDLFNLVEELYPVPAKGRHPAARIFQALRISVNRELELLEEALESALRVLPPGGRIAVISYHSLEDRIVKNFFIDKAADCVCPSGFPECRCEKKQELKIITKKPIMPGEQEITRNIRSRSAKMRVAEKV